MINKILLCALCLQTLNAQAQIQKPQTPQAQEYRQVPVSESPTAKGAQPASRPPSAAPVSPPTVPNTRTRQPEVDDAMNDLRETAPSVQYTFPSLEKVAGTEHYRAAFNDINNMLEGVTPLSIKRATFLTENAWYGNVKNYEYFNNDITAQTDIIREALRQAGYTDDNESAKKWILHRFMSDTLRLKGANGKNRLTHLPYKYDFDDPYGKQSWSKMFVTKLMSDKKGQCHSLPLLYLILAEELDVPAWLAYSPQHSYIKLKDKQGTWYNLELTNGRYSSDAWVQASGYIKADAMRSKIYMDTLSKQQLIAATLMDLANGYHAKFGYDQFVLDCAEKTLQYYPNNIFALQMKANYYTMLFQRVHKQLNEPPATRIHEYPQAFALVKKYKTMYKIVDQMGYTEMPEAIYSKWLKSFNEEQMRQPKTVIRP